MPNPCLLIYSNTDSRNPNIVYDPASDSLYAFTEIVLKQPSMDGLPSGLAPESVVAEIDLSKTVFIKDKSGLISKRSIEEQMAVLRLNPEQRANVIDVQNHLNYLIFSDEDVRSPEFDGLNKQFVVCDAKTGRTYTITGIAKEVPERAIKRRSLKIMGAIRAHKAICFVNKYGLVDSDALEDVMQWADLSETEMKRVRIAHSKFMGKMLPKRPLETSKIDTGLKIENG